jgi:hypothetical protein
MSDPEIVSAGDSFESLQRFRRWVACKEDKVPRQPGTNGRLAKVNDAGTWGDFITATQTVGAAYVGFVLTDLEHIVCLDLDHCRDSTSGKLTDWARTLLAKLAPTPTYIEVSMSGSGLHIFGVIKEDLPSGTFILPRGDNGQKIETYIRAARSVVITGKVFETQYPLADISDLVRALLVEHASRHGTKSNGKSNPNEATTLDGLPADVVDLIVNGTPVGADRSERLYYVVATLREHGRSRVSIIDALHTNPAAIAAKCFEHGKDEVARHVDMILKDIDDKIAAKAAAAAGIGACRPVIRLDPNRLTEVAIAAEAAMLAASLPIYEHGDGRLIHPIKVKVRGANNSWTTSAALGDIGVPLLRGFMSQAAMFERPGRKGWIACEPPERVAKLILGRRGFWRFPKIRGLVCVPTLRPDGTLLNRPGFDAETGLYLFDPPEMPPLPDRPTKDDAATGLALLNELLDEFPFRDNKSHSVALSGLLTPVVRGMFDVVPMHAFSSPQAGTGKSYLADLASVLISGQRCAVSTVSRSEEENEKRLGGTLLQGYPVLSIDNVDIPLNSAFLCQVIERSWLEIRILGTSNKPRVAPSLVLFCTGNNLVLVGDLVRRTVTALLDAESERPWTRRFKRNPLDMLLAARGHYIAAALNIVRAYLAAGKPAQKLEPFASFETWSNTVRAALVWLDQADPVETVAAAFEQDPDLLKTTQVFFAWAKEIGLNTGITVGEVIKRATGTAPAYIRKDDLYDALIAVASDKGIISADRLGNWLRTHKDRIVSVRDDQGQTTKYCLRRAGISAGYVHWMVVKT